MILMFSTVHTSHTKTTPGGLRVRMTDHLSSMEEVSLVAEGIRR